MFSAADLPDTVALFPLPQALLLPRARLPLHIFEPRYLAMLDDALKTSHRLIGMVQPIETEKGDATGLHDIGCAGRIQSFTETDDGRYMVSLLGVSRFRIQKELSGFTAYIKADVSWDEFHKDLGPAEHDDGFDRDDFLISLRRFFEAEDLSTDWESLREAGDELLINSLSMLCPFDGEDKQALLEAKTLASRRETLQTLIDYSLYGGNSDETMQ